MGFKQFLKESSIDPYKFLQWEEKYIDDLRTWLKPFQLEVGKAQFEEQNELP